MLTSGIKRGNRMNNFFFLAIISMVSACLSENIPTFMIIGLESRGVDTTTIQILTDKFKSELIKTGKVNVVEREKLSVLLKEQGLQQTGITNQDNIIKVGNLLNANRAISGEVGKVDGKYFLTIRILDIQSGKYIVSFDNMSLDLTEIMSVTIPEIAKKISLTLKDLLVLGDQKYKEGNYSDAISYYEIQMAYINNTDNSSYLEYCTKDVTCSYSDSYSAMCCNLADSYFQIGQIGDALRILKKDIATFPLGILNRLLLADIYYSQENFIDAEFAYTSITLLKKQYRNQPIFTADIAFFQAYFQLGKIHYENGLYLNSIEDFTHAIEIKKSGKAFFMRSKAFLFLNKKQSCISDLKNCLLLQNPENIDLHVQAKNMLDSLSLKD